MVSVADGEFGYLLQVQGGGVRTARSIDRHALFWAAAVSLLALVLVWSGLSSRDLTGDEIAIFTGTPWRTLMLALDPSEHFTGHMPLSYWLRWGWLGVLGEQSVLAWRLHAAIGFAGAVGLVMLAVPARGWALLAAAVLMVSPVATFHGMDSSNYGWSLLVGSWVLAALADPHRRRWWLVAALTVAAWNDLYSLWLGVGALVALVWVARPSRASLRRPAAVLAVLTAPLVVLVLLRLGLSDEAASVGMHADPASVDLGTIEVLLRRVQRLGGASLSGYAAGREQQLWERVPALLFPLLAGIGALRSWRPWGRAAGAVLLGGLGAALLASALTLVVFDRVLPTEPRVVISLLPALAVSVAAVVSSLGRGRLLAGGLLLGLSGMAMVQQHLDRSTLHSDVAAFVAQQRGPTERVVAPERIQAPLLEAGVQSSAVLDCLDVLPLDRDSLWWIQAQPIEQQFVWRGCHQSDGSQPDVEILGWQVTQVWTAGPPEHERNAAGFVRPVAAFRLERKGTQGVQLEEGRIGLTRALLDGLDGATVETSRLEPDGRWTSLSWFELGMGKTPTVSLDQPAMSRIRVRARPGLVAGLPEWSLLAPLERDVQAWELMIVDPQLTRAVWTLPAASLSDPWWQVFRRLGALVLVVLMALACVRGGRQ